VIDSLSCTILDSAMKHFKESAQFWAMLMSRPNEISQERRKRVKEQKLASFTSKNSNLGYGFARFFEKSKNKENTTCILPNQLYTFSHRISLYRMSGA